MKIGNSKKALSLAVGVALLGAACSAGAAEATFSTDISDSGESVADVVPNPRLSQEALESSADAEFSVPADGPSIVVPPNDQTFDNTFFDNPGVNPRIDTRDDALSTFALDVDTASYTVARGWLNSGSLVSKDAVRAEEFINFFDYGYEPPADSDFAVHVDGGPTPFLENDSYDLLRVGIQSRVVQDEFRPDAHLTFVVDVSGSMEQELPKVQQAMITMLRELRSSDSISIVVYGSNSRVILPATEVSNESEIVGALRQLQVDGSTNAEAGLRLGYEEARNSFDSEKINRVILLSDGVANVGNTGADSILNTIEEAGSDGIQLLTVGFGRANFNDVLLEQLANDGDGFYIYIDSQREAERAFSEDLTGTLLTVAQDAKIQVEFNPETVERYRLIGFENRAIADEDFETDVDAGEIGAGHSVTALYEIRLAEGVDTDGEAIANVDLRWKNPNTGQDRSLVERITTDDLASDWEDTSDEFKLATVAGTWAEVLRESIYVTGDSQIDLDQLVSEAEDVTDSDLGQEVDELAALVQDSVRLLSE